jgi:hypothetical protein
VNSELISAILEEHTHGPSRRSHLLLLGES